MSHDRPSRTRLGELLAITEQTSLLSLADACQADTPPVTHNRPPEVATVLLTVREPVELLRFHLADVLVTRVDVSHRHTRGWAMCLGDDVSRAVAAAILDAEVAAEGPWSAAVLALCAETERRREATRQAEWAMLATTIVAFEEIDS